MKTKRLIFDFDNTIYGEGLDNQRWLELYDLIASYGAERIWLFSNGSKWMKLQAESVVGFDHITDVERSVSDLELVDQCIQHAVQSGYQGLPDNAGLVKRCPPESILVDDLASTWVHVGKSNPDSTFTPTQFMDMVRSGELSLTIDSHGYLAAQSTLAG